MSPLLTDQQRLLRTLCYESERDPLRVVSLAYAAELAGVAVERVRFLVDRLRALGLIILAPLAEGCDDVGALVTLRGLHAAGLA